MTQIFHQEAEIQRGSSDRVANYSHFGKPCLSRATVIGKSRKSENPENPELLHIHYQSP
jgi:hypothetical protein